MIFSRKHQSGALCVIAEKEKRKKSDMKINVGFVGYGNFAKSIIPYFQLHPDVNKVALAELLPERREEAIKKFGFQEVYDSFDDMLAREKDLNCIAIHAQRHIHGDMVIRALKADKHIYSAVPMAITVEEVQEIVDLVKEKRLIYALGENKVYDQTTLFCKNMYTSGELGRFIYAEAEYYHDWPGFFSYKAYKGRDNWAGMPPIYYCTHSVSAVLSAIGERVTQVSCMGYHDADWEKPFSKGQNLWDNPYINETAIMRLSGGGVMRINEFRRVVKSTDGISSMNGTLASYERHQKHHVVHYVLPEGRERVEDVSVRFDPSANVANQDASSTYPPIQPLHRLPEAYGSQGLHHGGGHMFAVDDFVRAVKTGCLPPMHAWAAARYELPGIMAHESAIRNGEVMTVPDLGDPPADWDVLDMVNP